MEDRLKRGRSVGVANDRLMGPETVLVGRTQSFI